MIMPDDEIITNYKQAKDQHGQIQILADMNCVKASAMRVKLRELGLIERPSDEIIEKVDELYHKNYTDQEIASNVSGISKKEIREWRERNINILLTEQSARRRRHMQRRRSRKARIGRSYLLKHPRTCLPIAVCQLISQSVPTRQAVSSMSGLTSLNGCRLWRY